MKKFDVEITETLQRKVSVEAASQEDAERMVTQAWNNQDYVLDSGDFTGVDFKTVGEHELAETRTMDGGKGCKAPRKEQTCTGPG